MLSTIGNSKQVNVVVLFTDVDTPDYLYSVKTKWLGGKKNDVVVIIGTPNYPDIEWVRVLSWTDSEIFKVELQDSIYDLKRIDKPDEVVNIIKENVVSKFQRKHMKEFEYLKEEITVDTWVYFLAYGLCLMLSVVFGVFIKYWKNH
jgi:hypothetical protein